MTQSGYAQPVAEYTEELEEYMDKHIEHYLSQMLPELALQGIVVEDQHPIDWGCQLRLSLEEEKAVLNVYYSQKWGISVVVGGKSGARLKDILDGMVSGKPIHAPQPKLPSMHNWERWIGSDESGKGEHKGEQSCLIL